MIKNVPKNKSPGPDGFSQIIGEELITVFLKCIHKIAEGGTLPKSFCETNITMIPKPDKGNNNNKKLKTNITDEHRCKNPQQNSSKQNSTAH